MHLSRMHYLPLAWPFFLGLFVLLGILIVLVEMGILTYAYEKLGISMHNAFALLLLTLVGSYVNIPVAELQQRHVESDHYARFAGIVYVIPVADNPQRTIVAINVGGALIPTILSVYLLFLNSLYIRSIVGTAIVAVIVHHFAELRPGLGISVPIYIPPLAAVITAMVLSWRNAAPLGYIVGSLGTLIGADIWNLGNISGLDAPMASIGGAGTFDGVFLAGIIAVLLAPTVSQTIRKTEQATEVPPTPYDEAS